MSARRRAQRPRRRLRVLVLVHETLVPPPDAASLPAAEVAPFKTEFDVVRSLARLGHDATPLGVSEELAPIRQAIEELRPDVVFNLLEEFHGLAAYDQNVVSYLELLKVPYTGSGPRGMLLCRDKALSKKIVAWHRVKVPDFAVFPRGRKAKRPRRLEFPLIVKSLVEESSIGIAHASLVRDDDKLAERVAFVHQRIGTDAIAEQYVDGRELYVAILGNHRVQVLPTWELVFDDLPPGAPRIATANVKWNLDYQARSGIFSQEATDLPEGLPGRLERAGKRIFRLLGLAGYARLDFRLDAAGQAYFLEANPNPDIASDAEVSFAAEAAGMDHAALVQRILELALQRHRVEGSASA